MDGLTKKTHTTIEYFDINGNVVARESKQEDEFGPLYGVVQFWEQYWFYVGVKVFGHGGE